MLPTENPPCSSPKLVPVLRSDERASGKLALPELDLTSLAHNRPTQFSIRDYAFASRSEDICTNWPFPEQYLNLCLKNGVTNLLPPFEPPDLVRNHYSARGSEQQLLPNAGPVYSEDIISLEDAVSNDLQCEIHAPSDSSNTLEYPDQVQSSIQGITESKSDQKGILGDENKPIHKDDEAKSSVSCHGQAGRTSEPASELFHLESVGVQETLSRLEVAKNTPLPKKAEGAQELPQKKCRLVVRVSANPESTRSDDMPANSSVVSDFMASKVCPVCKTFSSTSNTTLNAHIDQCLSMEADVKQVEDKATKYKVKPSRKRLMVDIYSTAPHCTLEDLDRRNGSSWAVDLSQLAPNSVASSENKRQKIHPVDSVGEERKRAVYIDSNGTKLCILSKLTAPLLDASKESFQPKKLRQESDGERILSFSNGRKLTSKHSKPTKVKAHKKKLSSIDWSGDEVQVKPEGSMLVETDQESKEPLQQKFDVVDRDKNSRFVSLRNWACVKRSDVSKQLNFKVSQKNHLSGNQNPKEHGLVIDSQKALATKSHLSQFSRPSDDSSSLPKHKSMDVLSNGINIKDCAKKQSTELRKGCDNPVGGFSSKSKPLRLKIHKSSGHSSCLRSEEVGLRAGVAHTSDRVLRLRPRFSASSILPLEEENMLVSRKKQNSPGSSLLSQVGGCNSNKICLVSKKSQICRSINLAAKEANKLTCSDDNLGGFEPEEPYKCIEGVKQLNSSEDNTDKADSIINQQSHDLSDITESEQETEDSSAVQDENDAPLREGELEGGYHDRDFGNLGTKTGNLDEVDALVSSSLDGPVGLPTSTHPLNLKDQEVVYDAPLEENDTLIGGTEAWVELFASRSPATQVNCENEAGDNIIKNYCSNFEYMDCRTHVPSIASSDACLTDPQNVCFEIHQEHSCATSSWATRHSDYQMVVQKGSTGCPISAGSVISHPSDVDSKIEYSQPAPIVRHANDDTPGFSLSTGPVSPFVTKQYHIEERSMEKQRQYEPIPVPQEFEKLQDSSSCYCSGKESTMHPWQQSRQQNMDVTNPVKGMNVNSNMCFQSASSSFGYCPTLRSESRESPTSLQLQSTQNSVLRLMGKNLTVASSDEGQKAKPQNTSPHISSNIYSAQCPCLHNHITADSRPNMFCHPFQREQFGEVSMCRDHDLSHMHLTPQPPPAIQMCTFMGTVIQNGLNCTLKSQTDQMEMHRRQFLPFSSKVNEASILNHSQNMLPAWHPPYRPSDVIVIDDFPDIDDNQMRSQFSRGSASSTAISGPSLQPHGRFSCVTSQYPIISREISSQTNQVAMPCPKMDSHLARQGNPSQSLVPVLQSHFVVPCLSLGQLSPSFHQTPR